jgi:glycosyltransferase involved in cell wall biosynthesis
MLSIPAIGALAGPVVWTLHDMWGFCGTEHYPSTDRWRDGYRRGTRPTDERGLDVDRWTWRRKRRHWTRPMHIVAPSRWMADCVRASRLMRDWPVTVIPNAIDTGVWRPVDRRVARELLGLPPSWYKSRAYRARAVRDPRGVLAEFGTQLPEGTSIRVHDSNAELRYLVVPRRPSGTEGWDAAKLEQLVTRDAMIGVTEAGQP